MDQNTRMTRLDTFLNPTRWPFVTAAVSFALLLGAWGFQYIGHFDPCPLCYDQRDIHKLIILVSLVSGTLLILRPSWTRLAPVLVLLIAAGFAWSAGFSAWHAGIEYDWWAGPETCTASTGGSISTADVLAALSGERPVVMCDEAAWTLFGISMAGYNAIISAVLALASVWVAVRGARA
ncbi:disulfide bond formation protein B [Maricaulis sp. CAU 1757]